MHINTVLVQQFNLLPMLSKLLMRLGPSKIKGFLLVERLSFTIGGERLTGYIKTGDMQPYLWEEVKLFIQKRGQYNVQII